MNDSKPFLTSIEYAKKLGVSKRRVNAMCQKGELEGAYKDGYRWMIPANCIEGKVGTGNYYIESRTRSMGRTDLIIDYLGNRYVIEMKIWRGEEYNRRGEEQLTEYLTDYKLKKGYLLSFNFNKNKEVGVKTLHFKNVSIVEAVV